MSYDERWKKLLDEIHGDLRRLAESQLRRERPDHTLQPTALINEAWLRLVGDQKVDAGDRREYLRAASGAMRRVLVDHARRKKRKKREGGRSRSQLTDSVILKASGYEGPLSANQIVDLGEALEELQKTSPQLAAVVDLKFFADQTNEDVAATLGVSRATVIREWRTARAWLKTFLSKDMEEETRG